MAQKEKDYVIKEILVQNESIKQQLENLGFFKHEKIRLLNYNYGKKSYLIKVMGINYAIDKSVCENIEIADE